MAKKATSAKARKEEPRKSRSDKDMKPPAFLKAEDLRGRTTFLILPSIGLYTRQQDGSASLFIAVKDREKNVYTWAVNGNSPDRITLQQRHGRNLLDWPGNTVDLMPVNGSRGGRFVNIYDPAREPHSETKSRRQTSPSEFDDIPF